MTTSAVTRSSSGHPVTSSAEAEATVRAITIIVALIAGLTFLFGFGNCWGLGLRLGVPPWIAPLVGPAVDLSVVGLLLARRFLAVHGASAAELAPIQRLLIASCVVTLALNTAEPIMAGQYGKAAFDSVGPLLLMGWSETAPRLLEAIHRIRIREGFQGQSSAMAVLREDQVTDADVGESSAVGVSRDMQEPDLMEAARRADAQYWTAHRRPIPAAKLREKLGVSSTRARALVGRVRDEYPVAGQVTDGRRRGSWSTAVTAAA
ncbi:hypothetical protein [Prauserella flavalba]|uniref:hypothetical protein n=1 Tax=Prauserella flavalba TaxID=1477506 RepID=UPI0036EC8B17